jgi:hypothetical protein
VAGAIKFERSCLITSATLIFVPAPHPYRTTAVGMQAALGSKQHQQMMQECSMWCCRLCTRDIRRGAVIRAGARASGLVYTQSEGESAEMVSGGKA